MDAVSAHFGLQLSPYPNSDCDNLHVVLSMGAGNSPSNHQAKIAIDGNNILWLVLTLPSGWDKQLVANGLHRAIRRKRDCITVRDNLGVAKYRIRSTRLLLMPGQP
ncbi:MAG: hypothetical protein LBI39_01995 [Puniceicoccales bacterium]|jgi:hypothetical protein|nr:hypothetical protein [Puniceicoccales bacterium]